MDFNYATLGTDTQSAAGDSPWVHAKRSITLVALIGDAQSVTDTSASETAARKEFLKLAKKWQSETQHLSSPIPKYLNQHYARIIGLGPRVAKLIIENLDKVEGDWFYALRAVTGENPVSSEMAGDYDRMAQAWKTWAKNKGLIDGPSTKIPHQIFEFSKSEAR